MINTLWPESFRKRYGGVWPRTYLAFDLETTGFAKDSDVILEVGHCLVVDGEVKDRASSILNWCEDSRLPPGWFETKLRAVQDNFAQAGKVFPLSLETIKAKGHKPSEVLSFYGKMFQDVFDKQILLVGHNILGFDLPFWTRHSERFTHSDVPIHPDGIMDTSAIERIVQSAGRKEAIPRPQETLHDYMKRVLRLGGSGLNSSLDKHCFDKYHFDTFGLTKQAMHGADADSYAAHILMNCYRKMSEEPVPPEDPEELPPVDWTIQPKEISETQKRYSPKPQMVPPVPPPPVGGRVRGQRKA